MSTVRIPPVLRDAVGGSRQVVVSGGTVAEVLDQLFASQPALAERLTEQGALTSFVNVYVRAQDIRHLDGLQTSVGDDDEVILLPAMAGGAATNGRPGTRHASGQRWIDPRGHRFGALLSALVLLAAVAASATWLVALVCVVLGVSAVFGTRYSVFGRPWPLVCRSLRLGPVAPEIETAPRFAQGMGAAFLAIGVSLLAAGASPWGWIPIALVIGLQLLLAATGFCLGCRLYFLRRHALALIRPPGR